MLSPEKRSSTNTCIHLVCPLLACCPLRNVRQQIHTPSLPTPRLLSPEKRWSSSKERSPDNKDPGLGQSEQPAPLTSTPNQSSYLRHLHHSHLIHICPACASISFASGRERAETWALGLDRPSAAHLLLRVSWDSVHRAKLLLFVACLTSQQHASVSQGRICSDNFTCCHTEIEVADPTFYLTQSQYTDTGPTSPSADPITPGAWQGSHWSANF